MFEVSVSMREESKQVTHSFLLAHLQQQCQGIIRARKVLLADDSAYTINNLKEKDNVTRLDYLFHDSRLFASQL